MEMVEEDGCGFCDGLYIFNERYDGAERMFSILRAFESASNIYTLR